VLAVAGMMLVAAEVAGDSWRVATVAPLLLAAVKAGRTGATASLKWVGYYWLLAEWLMVLLAWVDGGGSSRKRQNTATTAWQQ